MKPTLLLSTPEKVGVSVQLEIARLIADLGCKPSEINNGNCDVFADALYAVVGGELLEFDLDSSYPTHVWVRHNGRHYDAECVDGVEDWRDLPIFA